jgi:hypothetical protein
MFPVRAMLRLVPMSDDEESARDFISREMPPRFLTAMVALSVGLPSGSRLFISYNVYPRTAEIAL